MRLSSFNSLMLLRDIPQAAANAPVQEKAALPYL
jgi:hypothetical protein